MPSSPSMASALIASCIIHPGILSKKALLPRLLKGRSEPAAESTPSPAKRPPPLSRAGLGGLSFAEGRFSVFGYTTVGREILPQIKYCLIKNETSAAELPRLQHFINQIFLSLEESTL